MKQGTLTLMSAIVLVSAAAQETDSPSRNRSTQLDDDRLSDIADSTHVMTIVHGLPEVMVTGEQPVVKAEGGRLTYDMVRFLGTTSAENAYDALRQLPGVAEDNQSHDGRLILVGGGNLTVVIDGKTTTLTSEQVMTLLKSTPASRLQSADLMLSAPAKYGVHGAVLDIHLNAIAADRAWQGELHTDYEQSHEATFTERATLVYRHGRWTVDALYKNGLGKWHSNDATHSIHTLNDQDNVSADGDMETYGITLGLRGRTDFTQHIARLGIDYEIAPKHQLNLIYNTSADRDDKHNVFIGDQTGTLTALYRTRLHNVRLDYRLPLGLRVSTEMTHYEAPTVQDMVYSEKFEGGGMILSDGHILTDAKQRIDRWHFSLRQEHELHDDWSLNYGAFYTTSLDNSRQTYDNMTTITAGNADGLSDMYSRRHEKILNVYAGVSKTWCHLSAEASIAAEHYKSATWDKWDLLPVVGLSYTPCDGHVFQLHYSSYRSYPDYWATIATTSYSQGVYTIIEGNPHLRPSTTHTLSSLYLLRSKYQFRLLYSAQRDAFMQQLYQSPTVLQMSYGTYNFDMNRQFILQTAAPFRAGAWLNGQGYICAVWQRQSSSTYPEPFDRRAFYVMIGGNATMKIIRKPDIRACLSGQMMQHRAIQGVYDINANGSLNFNLQWRFGIGRKSSTSNSLQASPDRANAHLTIYADDIFETSAVSPSIGQGRQRVKMSWQRYRSVGLSFTWSFGNYRERKHESVDTTRFKK